MKARMVFLIVLVLIVGIVGVVSARPASQGITLTSFPEWPNTEGLQPAPQSIREIIADHELTFEPAAEVPQYGSVLANACPAYTLTVKHPSLSYLYPATTDLNPQSTFVQIYDPGDKVEVVRAYVRQDGIWLDIWDPVGNGTFIKAMYIVEPVPQCLLDNAG